MIAAQVFKRPRVMRSYLTRDEHLHGPRNATLDQVIMYMLLKDKGANQPKVWPACSCQLEPCRQFTGVFRSLPAPVTINCSDQELHVTLWTSKRRRWDRCSD